MNNTVDKKIIASLSHGIQKSNPITSIEKECSSIGKGERCGVLNLNKKR